MVVISVYHSDRSTLAVVSLLLQDLMLDLVNVLGRILLHQGCFQYWHLADLLALDLPLLLDRSLGVYR